MTQTEKFTNLSPVEWSNLLLASEQCPYPYTATAIFFKEKLLAEIKAGNVPLKANTVQELNSYLKRGMAFIAQDKLTPQKLEQSASLVIQAFAKIPQLNELSAKWPKMPALYLVSPFKDTAGPLTEEEVLPEDKQALKNVYVDLSKVDKETTHDPTAPES